jgi:hypothetical protein
LPLFSFIVSGGGENKLFLGKKVIFVFFSLQKKTKMTISGPLARGALFEKTAPQDPPQKLFIIGRLIAIFFVIW